MVVSIAALRLLEWIYGRPPIYDWPVDQSEVYEKGLWESVELVKATATNTSGAMQRSLILHLRLTRDAGERPTLETLGRICGVSRSRMQQTEYMLLRRLRGPSYRKNWERCSPKVPIMLAEAFE